MLAPEGVVDPQLVPERSRAQMNVGCDCEPVYTVICDGGEQMIGVQMGGARDARCRGQ